jgi:PEP-CTERM motif
MDGSRKRLLRLALLAGVAAMGSTAWAAPTNYTLSTTIPIAPLGSPLTSFDISYVDPLTGIYYFADRSNKSVDIINGATDAVISQATGFVGLVPTGGPPAPGGTAVSGPDGVVVVNNGITATLYAGDGGSTLRSFNVTNPAAPVALGTVNTGGGQFRVDEMAYSPASNLVFAANNANSPAFATLVNATPPTPTIAKGNITIPGQVASGGMEQPVWNPNTGTFFVSVPTFNGTDAGGVQEFSTSGTALRTYNFSNLGISSCSPAGLVLGGSGNLTVGCGNAGTQTVVLNPSGAGSIVAKISAVSGSDELWYDPTTGNVFATGVNAAGDRVIGIISDSNDALLQSIDLTALGAGLGNLHSVAVDPLNDEIFVPLLASTAAMPATLCPQGCVAVFAQAESVPEPASLVLLAGGVAGLAGLSRRRRRKVA